MRVTLNRPMLLSLPDAEEVCQCTSGSTCQTSLEVSCLHITGQQGFDEHYHKSVFKATLKPECPHVHILVFTTAVGTPKCNWYYWTTPWISRSSLRPPGAKDLKKRSSMSLSYIAFGIFCHYLGLHSQSQVRIPSNQKGPYHGVA